MPHGEDVREDQGGGEAIARFPDLEDLEVVMSEDAEAVIRDALRLLLMKAAKKRVSECRGDRLETRVALALDEARGDAERSLEARIHAIIHGGNEDENACG